MNINSMINKCLIALAQKDLLYKYNTFKFYSEQTGRYSTKHQLLRRKIIRRKNGDQEKYIEIKTSYSNKDILTCLMKELKGLG
jgi:hypothetical protein